MKRELWSTETGFIISTAGAAIGLGQMWKFPYMAGVNGGAAFIFCYFIFLFVLAVPAFLGEVSIGAYGRQNPLDSLNSLNKKGNKICNLPGYFGLFTLFLVLCFYNVAGSWSLALIYKLIFNFSALESGFSELLASPIEMICFFLCYSLLSFLLVGKGVQKGIEKTCSILLPLLFLILIFLCVWGMQLPGFSKALDFMFTFNIKALSGKSILEAAGHSLFSLATGTGCALVYGSHIPKGVNLLKATFAVTVSNILVCLSVGIAIFSILFSYGLSPDQGPTLMYLVLPKAFCAMPYGQIVGLLFFSTLFIAALTSSLSMIEPIVGTWTERWKIKRVQACLYLFILAFLPSVFCIFSFNILSEIRILQHTIFEFIADLSSSILLCLGALGFSMFAVRAISLKQFQALLGGDKIAFVFATFIRFSLKFVVPFTIAALLFQTIFL